jgi:polyferredoxin
MVVVKKNIQTGAMEAREVNHTIMIIPGAALLLLGAHGVRQGEFGLAAALVCLTALAATRRGWVRLAMIAALAWGGMVWAEAAVGFIGFRMAAGLPWERLSLIMGGLIVFDSLALWVLFGDRAAAYFSRQGDTAVPRAALFLLTAAGLAVARAKVPFPVLLADRYLPGWGWLEVMALGVYAQWVGGLMLAPKGQRLIRPRIWIGFSVVFFAQLVLGLVGMDAMLMTGSLHLPVPALIAAGPVFRGDGFFMPLLFGVTVLLVGPAWCSHLCYIGAWDDAMSRRGASAAPSARLRRLNVAGRGTTLALVIGAALVLRAFGVPGTTAVLYAVVFGLAGVGVMLLISRRMGVMVHCVAFCPMGLVAAVLGRISPWRIRVGGECTGCGVCLARCRYGALDDDRLAKGSPSLACTLCGDCVSTCMHGQMTYRFPGLSSQVARTVFIVLVVSLHAVFLGVARI